MRLIEAVRFARSPISAVGSSRFGGGEHGLQPSIVNSDLAAAVSGWARGSHFHPDCATSPQL